MVARWNVLNILVKQGVITMEAVQRVQAYCNEKDSDEITALKDLRIVSEETVAAALAAVFSIQTIDLDNIALSPDALEEIPYEVASKLLVLPIKADDTKIMIAVSDPSNITALETLKLYTDKEIMLWVAPRSSLQKKIELQYSKSKSSSAAKAITEEYAPTITYENQEDELSDEPTVKLSNSVLQEAVLMGVSDIHIEPYETSMMIRYRLDGKLKEIMRLPISAYAAISSRFKMLAGMDIAERRVPQDGRIQLRVGESAVDVRVSTLPNATGEKIVMRVLEKGSISKSKAELGFSQEDLDKINGMLEATHGVVLVTGPTGSGKSTTLYSFINDIKSPEKAIVTVEDPIEYMLEGINQVPINYKQGMTFPKALASILRQDPDVIMIGEMRDEETVSIAIRASITGHLVLSTLHTNGTIASISRLADMNVQRYLLADSLRGVIAQRLLRKICPYCAEEYLSSSADMKELEIDRPSPLVRGVGCKKCNFTGYKGRFGLYEILTVSNDLKKLIENGASTHELNEQARREGMLTLKELGMKAVLEKKTSMEEYRMVAHNE